MPSRARLTEQPSFVIRNPGLWSQRRASHSHPIRQAISFPSALEGDHDQDVTRSGEAVDTPPPFSTKASLSLDVNTNSSTFTQVSATGVLSSGLSRSESTPASRVLQIIKHAPMPLVVPSRAVPAKVEGFSCAVLYVWQRRQHQPPTLRYSSKRNRGAKGKKATYLHYRELASQWRGCPVALDCVIKYLGTDGVKRSEAGRWQVERGKRKKPRKSMGVGTL